MSYGYSGSGSVVWMGGSTNATNASHTHSINGGQLASPFVFGQYQNAWPAQQPAPEVKRESMRGLFEVFVVDPESSDVIVSATVVADSEDKARLKVARDITQDLDDVDIIVRMIGQVRPRRRVQEVKVVRGD